MTASNTAKQEYENRAKMMAGLKQQLAPHYLEQMKMEVPKSQQKTIEAQNFASHKEYNEGLMQQAEYYYEGATRLHEEYKSTVFEDGPVDDSGLESSQRLTSDAEEGDTEDSDDTGDGEAEVHSDSDDVDFEIENDE
ncbi:hypothetical protein LTS18_002145 [Coniosporium uncinatum]|uniref:Uncharacterized protein n=1 Tax=Coniosporium uncinatum TaxID=93489 RepID=A0ACC3D7Y5_9PEZI|nr:hypothetical protein LTS18_002145 [Coniosporium uncinatum]